jgi:hypothetical protein
VGEVVGLASHGSEERLDGTSQERPRVRRDGDYGGHCEQDIGNSINQHNAENDHGDEGKAQAYVCRQSVSSSKSLQRPLGSAELPFSFRTLRNRLSAIQKQTGE